MDNKRKFLVQLIEKLKNQVSDREIAIIGVTGRYPQANTLEDFWDNLKNGQNGISEIPPDRWNWQEYYDENATQTQIGQSYSKWGGFIADVDKFDPLFFNISPREAKIMDPQERLFLETVWALFEDAGYTRQTLVQLNHQVGTFVGVMNNGYEWLGAEATAKGQITPTYSAFWSIANRVSYYFNLTGPSLAIDTACSSSLTAIHLACDSLKKGECQIAIAGGVNLILHPMHYYRLCLMNMLASDDQCKSFGEGADGFIDGEGVGAVLLKPLNRAIENGDTIYAVIKGSSINAGGKTSGYTVPNPNAQAELIKAALKNAKIDPRTISYVEAHGTGTSLGDPIEISGLMKAYQAHTRETQYCSIGSVKSNIGHLESAAGIAGLTKVLLSMKHRQLVPSLHSERLNPHINFKESPFYVQQTLAEWKQPVIKENGEERRYPRRAGISSFGAGGANAHLILEEYEPPLAKAEIANQEFQLIVLSAKNEERLHAYIHKIIDFLNPVLAFDIIGDVETTVDEVDLFRQIQSDLLKIASVILNVSDLDIDLDEAFSEYGFDTVSLTELSHQLNDKYFVSITPALLSEYPSLAAVAQYLCDNSQDQAGSIPALKNPKTNLSLASLAYTLQMGREAMEERLAMVVSSVGDLKDKLSQYVQGQTEIDDFYRGNVSIRLAQSEFLIEGEEGKDFVKSIVKNKKLTKLAQLWVSGIDIDWQLLYPNHKPQRISLPTYPFERRRCWFDLSQQHHERLEKSTIISYQSRHVTKAHGINTPIEAMSTPLPAADDKPKRSKLVLKKPTRLAEYQAVELHSSRQATDAQKINTPIEVMSTTPLPAADAKPKGPNMSTTPLPAADDKPKRPKLVLKKPTGLAEYQAVELHSSPEQEIVETSIPQKSFVDVATSKHQIKKTVKFQLAEVLCLDSSEIDDKKSLSDLGVDSILGVELVKKLNEAFQINMKVTQLYDNSTVEKLSEYLRTKRENSDKEVVIDKPGTVVSLVSEPAEAKFVDVATSKHQIKKAVKFHLAQVLCLEPSEIDDKKLLSDLGVDSILGVELVKKLNEAFQINMKVTQLYDNSTVEKLSEYLRTKRDKGSDKKVVIDKPGTLMSLVSEPADAKSEPESSDLPKLLLNQEKDRTIDLTEKETELRNASSQATDSHPLKGAWADQTVSTKSNVVKSQILVEPVEKIKAEVGCQDIAIIGMSGRFPGANGLDEFWDNLKNGICSVTEIPTERWSINHYYDPDPKVPGKSYSKWGGFLEDFDKFDPLFFNISPAEAELMDPQQRWFLQEAWCAFENAGYSAQSLSNTKCGVYVGVMGNDYVTLLDNSRPAQEMLGNSGSILASRIAYFLNLKGPVVTLDTACSSSLVAIHLACQSLKEGETEMMLAGGVTLYVTEKPYIQMSKAGMLSPDNKCKTFDNSANGFVPAEGVGVVVLKLLDKAMTDGDFIYGVIKGTGINQDGETNGITAPSSESQKALEIAVYDKNKINPETITYVEAHGTGTKLGDPIEIDALTCAFRKYTQKKQYCFIGSVKTNLGHTSAAAGVASVMKVLLALKHRQIPPSLHFENENEHINFKDSPFKVNSTLREWKTEANILRRAAISSFGFSGTNAHIVLEEYEQPRPISDSRSQYPQLIVLSAKNDNRLQAVAQQMVDFLEKHPDILWPNLAYTLQVGREAMEERLAMVASGVEDFKKKLTQYVQGQTEIDDFERGNISIRKAQSELLIEGEEGKEFLRIIIKNQKLTKLAQLWISGTEIDWQLLYPNQKPQRISLPTYPFARERYWIPTSDKSLKIVDVKGQTAKLHPLLDSNESTLEEQCFKKVFYGEEFYLTDHQVDGQSVLPAVVYLEMARASGNLANRKLPVRKLTNVVWAMPLIVSDTPRLVHINLYPVQWQVEFEISTLDDNQQKQVHAQGQLTYGSETNLEPETIDIEAIQNRCFETWDRVECYDRFQSTGLNYGPGFQTIQALYHNDTEALSRLQLPTGLKDGFNDLVLHPSLMDGALQTVIGLMSHTSQTPYFLFSLGEVELRGPLSDQSYAYVSVANHSPVTETKVTQFNISIVDGSGQVRVRLSDFSVRALTQPADTPVKKLLGIEGPQPIPAAKVASQDHHVQTAIESQIESDIKDIVSELLKINPQKLEVNENLGYFGLDSISLKELANKLSDTYQIDMSPSVFFAHSSIQSLSAYLLEEFEERMKSFYTNTEIPLVDKPDFGGENLPPLKPRALFRDRRPEISTDRGFDTIAIIGAHGVFPGSKDLSTFWHHLQAEHDLITEVPQDRWDWRECYGGTDIKNNKSNSKWGGFIPDVDKFDARFFKIPSREAEMMDPQHRLFIETVWKTIEDAGYRASELSGKAVGVFVGVEFHDYQQLLLKNQEDANPHAVTGNSPALLANRVSFLLNLRGPSESIETACSASLIAIHHAVNSIRRGESQLAIAGGVSLMLSPEIMIGTSQLGVLSPDGRCKTFDKSANGYVKGEGVGAVLLKPLSQAIADNDNIYAVIKGTAVNHGGKATSLTAPNSDAQAALLTKAYLEAGITPDTVTYLEVHGTGTELGDPVEIEGIKMAFRELASKQAKTIRQSHYCGLGSVKTNIGHLEPASGIAGLLKVILAMRHQYLPGILHLRTLNPYIELKDTPFYVVDKGRAWERLKDEEGHLIPRRAGISSFGFGGANAHMVLEEYENPQRSDILSQTPQLIVLSAKNDARLQAYAKEIIEFISPLPSINATEHQGKVAEEAELRQQIQQYLRKAAGEILKVNNLDIDPDEALSEYGFDTVSLTGLCQRINDKYQISITSALLSEQKSLAAVAQYLCDKSQEQAGVKEGTTFNRETNFSLADLAYTLQVGREAMEERLAMVVSSPDEVRDKLTQYAQGQTEIEDFYRGNVKTNRSQSDLLIEGEAGEAFLRVVIEKKELTKLAQLWLSGVEIDWQLLYTNHQKPQRISLPTYPFAKDRYWLADVHSTNDVSQELEPVCLNKTQIEDVVKDEFKNLLTTEVGELDNLDLDKPFDNYGIDSIGLLGFRQKLQEKTSRQLEWKWLLGESSPKMLIDHLSENINQIYGGTEEETWATMLETEWMEGNPKRWYQLPHKNVHPIVLNITSLRHGSSLTSFILNANPHLYAPQGLYLLPFVNLKEREEALKQQTLFLEHGLPATIQDLWQVNEIAAHEMIQEWTIQNVPIQEIYHLLQEKCAPRILVDRGTIYGQNLKVLQRAEQMFQNVKYLHLVRHPYSVLSSGVLMLQKTLVLKNLLSSVDDEEAARALHDYVDGAWYITHVNALNVFKEIETNRWYRIKYEDLLTDTRNKLEEICELIGVPFDESMLRPYDVPENVQLHNMSDDSGIATRDPKLMQRNQIDSKNANTWAKNIPQRKISPTTEYIATQFGYSLPHKDHADKTTDVLVKLNAMDSGLPVFMFPGSGGNILAFFKIASALKRPVWALRALDYAPMDSFQNLAAFYVNYLMDQIEDECCLVGYSSGVCTGWEVANQLMDKNIQVKNLIMLDRNPFDAKSEVFGSIQNEEGSVRYEEYPETYALLVLGIAKGLSKDRLSALLKVLQSRNEKPLFSVFQDFLLPTKIEMEEISQFVWNFIQQRRMLKNYQPSMAPEVKNKIGILAAESPKTEYPPGTTEIVVENCDHISILTSDNLIVALSNVLT